MPIKYKTQKPEKTGKKFLDTFIDFVYGDEEGVMDLINPVGALTKKEVYKAMKPLVEDLSFFKRFSSKRDIKKAIKGFPDKWYESIKKLIATSQEEVSEEWAKRTGDVAEASRVAGFADQRGKEIYVSKKPLGNTVHQKIKNTLHETSHISFKDLPTEVQTLVKENFDKNLKEVSSVVEKGNIDIDNPREWFAEAASDYGMQKAGLTNTFGRFPSTTQELIKTIVEKY